MKLLVAAMALTLSACVSVPVERKFPNTPDELKVSCPQLQLVPGGTTQLSDVLETVVANYGQYQSCQYKVEAWIEWYSTQKTIFDDVK